MYPRPEYDMERERERDESPISISHRVCLASRQNRSSGKSDSSVISFSLTVSEMIYSYVDEPEKSIIKLLP